MQQGGGGGLLLRYSLGFRMQPKRSNEFLKAADRRTTGQHFAFFSSFAAIFTAVRPFRPVSDAPRLSLSTPSQCIALCTFLFLSFSLFSLCPGCCSISFSFSVSVSVSVNLRFFYSHTACRPAVVRNHKSINRAQAGFLMGRPEPSHRPDIKKKNSLVFFRQP